MADTQTKQHKPLAPPALQVHSDEEQLLRAQPFKLSRRQKNYLNCCGCVSAIFSILAVLILVLAFTVFDIKDPKVRFNIIMFQQPPQFAPNGTTLLRTDVNVTLLVDVSVKNPNAASFKFNKGTTTIYYHGNVIGEARIPAGKAKARKTIHMNVSVDIKPDKFSAYPGFLNEVSTGKLEMNSSTLIDGKVKILTTKKHAVVELNCTFTYNIKSTKVIEEPHCRPHFCA